MSEPKLNAVFVRLTKDFPVGAQHRRAGITLGAGPRPVSVEVTDEQLADLEGDRYVEIVSDKEAKKWEERLGEEPLKTSSEVASENEDGNEGGRNYGDGNKGGSSNDDEDEGDGLDDLKFDALKELAQTEEVDISGLKSKDEVREAIRTKRVDSSNDDEE